MNVDEMADGLPKRIVFFCNRAPRTWDEIVGCMAGVSSPHRETHSMEEAQRVHVATQVLWEMVRDGRMVRTPAADPREDCYAPR
jgi:hypothetical protein